MSTNHLPALQLRYSFNQIAINAMHSLRETMMRHTAGNFAAALILSLAAVTGGCDLISGPGIDERAPKVEIIRPGNKALVGGEVLLRIDATPLGDDNYVSFVNVTVNGRQAGEATYVDKTTKPYVFYFKWNTFDVTDGEYRVEAIAYDKFQARGLSNPVRLSVKNVSAGDGPFVDIITPRESDAVFGTQRIIAEPREGQAALVRMDFLINGATVFTLTKPPYAFDWKTEDESEGDHVIRVKAYTASDVFRYSDPVTVLVEREEVDPDSTDGKLLFSANGFRGEVEGGVAVGFNNDLYIATHSGTPRDTLYAYTPAGSIRWKAQLGPVRSSPVVGNNEDIFVTSEDGRLYGFTSTGKRLWPPYNTGAIVRSSPAFGAEGALYFGDSEGKLHAVNSFDGLPLPGWPARVTNVPITVPPVITRDHTVIVAATDGYIYAHRPDGRQLWKSTTNIGSVSVGMALVEREFQITLPNGQTARTKNTVVYVVSNSGRIYALTVDTNGSINWEYALTGPLRTAPVVGPDGTIYIGTSTGLVALNEEVDQFTPRLRFIHVANDVGTPVVDSNENVYFVSGKRLVAINPNNKPLWDFDLKMEADGPLTIGRNGLVFVAGENGVLYGLSTGSVGLAREKWPMFQRNSRHSGRLGIDATDG